MFSSEKRPEISRKCNEIVLRDLRDKIYIELGEEIES
jgi:hypothetical protein